VQQFSSGGQAPYLNLLIDLNNDGVAHDQLFFEPVYQTGAFTGDPIPNQGTLVLGQWQTWDALVGGWWSLNAGTFGPPLVTLATYIAANPTATIVNAPTGAGGVRILAGFGAGAWDNFVGNVDAFTIGVSGNSTTYDFEPFAAGGVLEPTETKVVCAVQVAPSEYRCVAIVGDAGPGAGVDPIGTVAFFLDTISTSSFVGQCTTGALPGTLGGISTCLSNITVPTGPHTIWAVFYRNAAYGVSVGSDDLGNTSVAPPDPTDTKIVCVPTGTAGTTQPLDCAAAVADDDTDPGPPPVGVVAFFRDAIASNAFVGQCQLAQAAGQGLSFCRTLTSPVPAGTSTMWGVFYPSNANYQGSVDSDQVPCSESRRLVSGLPEGRRPAAGTRTAAGTRACRGTGSAGGTTGGDHSSGTTSVAAARASANSASDRWR
jgi:hypothetical protein